MTARHPGCSAQEGLCRREEAPAQPIAGLRICNGPVVDYPHLGDMLDLGDMLAPA
jgi:hypothetical protein